MERHNCDTVVRKKPMFERKGRAGRVSSLSGEAGGLNQSFGGEESASRRRVGYFC